MDWFKKLREQVGIESWLCALIAIAGADEVLQHGINETMINRTSTMNQWCLLDVGGDMQIVTIEAGGLMIGGTAADVKKHVEETWQRGQIAIEALRLELGEHADALVPMRRGGVNFLKVMSEMHDTCNAANASARALIDLKEECGAAFSGEDA